MDAFDADVLIYAATPGHPLGQRVAGLFAIDATIRPIVGVGSILLVPALLIKPQRRGWTAEATDFGILLTRLDLKPVDERTADLATTLGVAYALRAVDAVHLATAVLAGADRFITNNTKDFDDRITEIRVVHPSDL